MRFRKLRIAWSVAWGVVALLLIVLWVRSYYFADLAQLSVSKWSGYQFTSTQGQLTLHRSSLDGAGHDGGTDFADWLWSTTPAGSMFEKSPTTFGFDLRHLPYFIALPYWVPLLVCVVLAATPMLIRHQFIRFSLRTLLIATTLVAVVLGAICYAVR